MTEKNSERKRDSQCRLQLKTTILAFIDEHALCEREGRNASTHPSESCSVEAARSAGSLGLHWRKSSGIDTQLAPTPAGRSASPLTPRCRCPHHLHWTRSLRKHCASPENKKHSYENPHPVPPVSPTYYDTIWAGRLVS